MESIYLYSFSFASIIFISISGFAKKSSNKILFAFLSAIFAFLWFSLSIELVFIPISLTVIAVADMLVIANNRPWQQHTLMIVYYLMFFVFIFLSI